MENENPLGGWLAISITKRANLIWLEDLLKAVCGEFEQHGRSCIADVEWCSLVQGLYSCFECSTSDRVICVKTLLIRSGINHELKRLRPQTNFALGESLSKFPKF